MGRIESRVPAADYFARPGLSISRLKEMRRSPLHYQHALANPKTTAAMTLGTAAHCATLEPERFGRDYAVWARRTESGRLAPRNGKAWDAFVAEAGGRDVLTEEECSLALAIGTAVRRDPVAGKYLVSGEPEVTMEWELAGGRACKGRVDWLTHMDDGPVLVGLKTARECRHFAFATAAAKLGYHLQWGWYADGWHIIKGTVPRVVEIVVESAPPHAVVVYDIGEDVLAVGRDEYQELLRLLDECERRNEWRGPAQTELVFTLPKWVTGGDENLTDLDLEIET